MGRRYNLPLSLLYKLPFVNFIISRIYGNVNQNIKQIEAKPGTTEFSTVDNPIEFKNVTVPSGGTLKAFLLITSTLEPVGKSKNITFSGVEEYHVLAFGNSYSANSFSYLPKIAAGVNIYAVNMNTGG